MVALSEVSKRGPRLTPEQEAAQKRQRTQARVGLASNALGLTAGGAALVGALKDPALRKKTGTVIPATPASKITRKAKWLAGGALALQAANIGGDVVANRVLARSAQDPSVKKDDGEWMLDSYISKDDHTTGFGKRDMGDDEWDRRVREQVRPAHRAMVTGSGISGGILGGLTGSLAGGPKHAGRRAAIGAGIGAAGLAGLQHHVNERQIRHAKKDPVKRYAVEQNIKAYDRLKANALAAQQRREGVGKAAPYKGMKSGLKSVNSEKLRQLAAQRAKDKAVLARLPSPSSVTDPELMRLRNPYGKGIAKAYRRYDPEADRQRRLGLMAGAGGAGAALTGQAAIRRMTADVRGPGGNAVRGLAIKPGKGKGAALYSLAALGSGALGVGAYRRGVSERNNPWN